MNKHYLTDKADYNYSMLEERLLEINDVLKSKYKSFEELMNKLKENKEPTLIIATGGSKTVGSFLKKILEDIGIICELIEPRDYFHKNNISSYKNLIVISASGKSNGVEESLSTFIGNKYLITEEDKEKDYKVISWGNETYTKEKSFISLATSLGPIVLFLDTIEKDILKVNEKVKLLLKRSKEKIDSLDVSFKDTKLIEVISGYETRPSDVTLESNLVETGTTPVVIHDKSSFCHGRSNLKYNYPNSKIIYLTHEINELDRLLLSLLAEEYKGINIITTEDLEENAYWKEFYMLLQIYFLSRKIADDKGIDITQPEYNRNIVKKVYTYRGEM